MCGRSWSEPREAGAAPVKLAPEGGREANPGRRVRSPVKLASRGGRGRPCSAPREACAVAHLQLARLVRDEAVDGDEQHHEQQAGEHGWPEQLPQHSEAHADHQRRRPHHVREHRRILHTTQRNYFKIIFLHYLIFFYIYIFFHICSHFFSAVYKIILLFFLKLSAQPYGRPNAKYVHFCTFTRYLMCT